MLIKNAKYFFWRFGIPEISSNTNFLGFFFSKDYFGLPWSGSNDPLKSEYVADTACSSASPAGTDLI